VDPKLLLFPDPALTLISDPVPDWDLDYLGKYI
jgi:hypothetical protein